MGPQGTPWDVVEFHKVVIKCLERTKYSMINFFPKHVDPANVEFTKIVWTIMEIMIIV
jgi:hypothetical protein